MEQQPKTRKPYTSDLTDDQWKLLHPQLVLPEGGHPKTTDLREVINGIFYPLKTGWWDMRLGAAWLRGPART